MLSFAILMGIVAGTCRALLADRRYQPAHLRQSWLLFLSFLPQALAFYLPATRAVIPDWLASLCLVCSQIGLLGFVWLNRKLPGQLILGTGLAANLLVIILNGGLMPIAPSTATMIYPGFVPGAGAIGSRLGWSKDVILPEASMNFSFLSDHLTLPAWMPWQFAFSPGDLLIAIGVFWLLWAGGAGRKAGELYQP